MPYYKIQVFNPHVFAWQDIQRSYATITEAKEALPKHKQARVMAIDERRRSPVYLQPGGARAVEL